MDQKATYLQGWRYCEVCSEIFHYSSHRQYGFIYSLNEVLPFVFAFYVCLLTVYSFCTHTLIKKCINNICRLLSFKHFHLLTEVGN